MPTVSKLASSPAQTADPRNQPWLLRFWLAWDRKGRPYSEYWGRFVATRQLAVLLLGWLMLCFAFLPAFSLYISSWRTQDNSILRALSRPLREIAGAGSSQDVVLPWNANLLDKTIVTSEGEPCWTRSRPLRRMISVEQVWLSTDAALHGYGSEHGVIDREPLHSALRFQDALSTALDGHVGESGWKCVRDLRGKCIITSPLLFFNNSESQLLGAGDLLGALSSPETWVDGGLPLSYETSFARRQPASSGAPGPLHKADWLAMTCLLEWTPEYSSHAPPPTGFQRTLQSALTHHGKEAPLREYRSQRRLTLKHHSSIPNPSTRPGDIALGLGYFLVAVYVTFSFMRLPRVYSRVGLFMTSVTDMVVGGLTSISICSLIGVKFEVVPWKLLPMLFVVIGSDNTLMLTNAVTATSVDLPIAERIAQGFGNIALHLFVSVIIELSMLWLAALSGLAAVRELCIFTAIAVLVDWELQMTVYLSTLTIDMQRFELADYFSQRGSALGGSSSEVKPKTPPKVYKNSLSVLRAAFCATVMERLARAALFSMAPSQIFLYLRYGSRHFVPPFCSEDGYTLQSPNFNRLSPPDVLFWRMLNPRNVPVLHVLVNSPIVVALRSRTHTDLPATLPPLTIQPTVSIVKGVLLPTIISTILLGLYLSDLMKDGDQLAQVKSRAADKLVAEKAQQALAEGPRVSLEMLRHRSKADVELVALAREHVATWVALDDYVRILSLARDAEIREVPLGDYSPTILALDAAARYLAIATKAGDVVVFSTSDGQMISFPADKRLDYLSVVALLPDRPELAALPRPGQTFDGVSFFAVRSDGSVFKHSCSQASITQVCAPLSGERRPRTIVLQSDGAQPPMFIRGSSTGAVAAFGPQEGRTSWPEIFGTRLEGEETLVSAARVQSSERRFVVFGLSNGRIELREAGTGEFLGTIANVELSLHQLAALSIMGGPRCPVCAEPMPSSMLVIASTVVSIHLYRVVINQKRTALTTCTCRASAMIAPRTPLHERIALPKIPAVSPTRSPSTTSSTSDGDLVAMANGAANPPPAANANLTPARIPLRRRSSAGRMGNRASTDGADNVDTQLFSVSPLNVINHDNRGRWMVCGRFVMGLRRRKLEASRASSTPMDDWEAWSIDGTSADVAMHDPLPVVTFSAQKRGENTSKRRDPLARNGSAVASAAPTPVLSHQLPFSRVGSTAHWGDRAVLVLGNSVLLASPASRGL